MNLPTVYLSPVNLTGPSFQPWSCDLTVALATCMYFHLETAMMSLSFHHSSSFRNTKTQAQTHTLCYV